MTFPRVCSVADKFEWLPPRNIGGYMPTSRGLVLHVNAGNGDPFPWWTNPTTPTASSHFQLMKSGVLIQYVGLDTVAWCQVAGSSTWHSIETEGWPNEPLTEAAVNKLAKLYSWGHQACGWRFQLADSPSGLGFGWHGMGGYDWGGHFGCPGDARKAQRARILQLASSGHVIIDGGNDPMSLLVEVDFNQRHSMEEPAIRNIRYLLAARGMWYNPADANGDHVRAMVHSFQQIVGLKPDLVVGPMTYAKLVTPQKIAGVVH